MTSSVALALTGAPADIGAPSSIAAALIRGSRSARMVGRSSDSEWASAAATVLLPVPPFPVTKRSRASAIALNLWSARRAVNRKPSGGPD